MSNIHYSEGEFPLNIYGPDCYGDGYVHGMFSGAQWAGRCCCDRTCKPVELFITDVRVSATRTITMTISFSDGTVHTCVVEIGKKYTVKYVENGEIVQVSGIVTNIGDLNTVADCPCCTNEYIIQLDCSTVGHSSVLNIRTSMIRYIEEYAEYLGEDTEFDSCVTYGCTIYGNFENVIIQDATIDADGNVTKGKIASANLATNAVGLGGCSIGLNSRSHSVVAFNGITKGGVAIEGTVLSARVYSPIVTGGTGTQAGVLTGALVKADTANIVAIDCTVSSGKGTGGTIINPVLENSMVNGGVRSGEDMQTTGAAVFGAKGYGGMTTGGTLYGGTAVGNIKGIPFTIYNGETTGGTTMKAIVENGIIKGGTHVGNTVIGSIIYSGSAKDGTTTGGTTTLGQSGYIKPGYNTIPEGLTNLVNDCNTYTQKEIDDLIIWWRHNSLYTNLVSYQGPACSTPMNMHKIYSKR